MVYPEILQLVTLTCNGNAYLAGEKVPSLAKNSHFMWPYKYMDFIKAEFAPQENQTIDDAEFVTIAKNPDEWFKHLKTSGATGIRFSSRKYRRATGVLEVTRSDGKMDIYRPILNAIGKFRTREATSSYLLIDTLPDAGPQYPSVEDVYHKFREALVDIRDFAHQHQHANDNWESIFASALLALDDPRNAKFKRGERNIWIPGQLSPLAEAMLVAAQRSWVYGGMGSWNDLVFADQSTEEKYFEVSKKHERLMYEAFRAGASSSHMESS